MMVVTKAYEEVIDFIAAGNTPEAVVAFRPTEAARARCRSAGAGKGGGLKHRGKSELDHYAQLEHLMRLAKARARQARPSPACRPG